MAEWSNNNKACVSVWFYLRKTGQIKTNFKNSENVTMGECRFWNDHSPDATEAYARGWAEWYITYITTKDGAKFESGYNWAKSVNELVATMTVKENTVAALATAADDAVFFFEEVKA